MKKFSAILLIALFLFNLFGYRILFDYEQQQSDIRLKTSLDKQEYNEAELVLIKVPLSLPYITDQQDFERVDGEITIDGKILKYVKRKISDGHLILLCLPDHNKMRIESAKDEFFKYANDLVQNNQSKKSENSKTAVFKNRLSDYDINTREYAAAIHKLKQVYTLPSQSNYLPHAHSKLLEQPPEVI